MFINKHMLNTQAPILSEHNMAWNITNGINDGEKQLYRL